MERIRAVTFDADGTLWDFQKVMRYGLQCALDELCRRVPDVPDSVTVDRMIATRDELATQMPGVRMEAIRRASFVRLLDELGVSDVALADHLTDRYLAHRFDKIELYDDVRPTLGALVGRVTLGLISNGNTYPEKCGLPGRFRFAVFAHDHGSEKPHPHLFRIALRHAQCRPDEMMHVGDSLTRDVVGACRVGIVSVWLNRDGKSNDTDVSPAFEIGALTELPTLLDAP